MKKLIVLIAGIIIIAPALCYAGDAATNECAESACAVGAATPAATPESTESAPEKPAGNESTVEHAAHAIERATTATSIACGISPAPGLAALPCLAVDTVNFASKAVGWIVRHVTTRSEEGDSNAAGLTDITKTKEPSYDHR